LLPWVTALGNGRKRHRCWSKNLVGEKEDMIACGGLMPPGRMANVQGEGERECARGLKNERARRGDEPFLMIC
jgi:hypothetical protein